MTAWDAFCNGLEMRAIRLIREVSSPTGRGPGNGMYALQRALHRHAPGWLRIGGVLQSDEIPWFWSWQDRTAAAACALAGQAFVAGPNVLFDRSSHPCRAPGEREVCEAASCRLLFTESAWYRDLIEEHRGPKNRAPVVLWPYPIDPRPGGPAPPRHALLLDAKSGYRQGLIQRLVGAVARSRVIYYGAYRREELFEAARRARGCLYLSGDDRGPLALAEILLAGCPPVGRPRGAPFIEPGRTGFFVGDLSWAACFQAVHRMWQLDRSAVAAAAAAQFDTARIVGVILDALRTAAE